MRERGTTPDVRQGGADGPATPAMYVAGFGIVVCAVTTAVLGLELTDPLFGVTIIGMAGLGFSVSLAARHRPSAGWALAALVGSILGLFALGTSSGGFAGQLFPASSSGDVHRDLGVFLCWLMVLLSFAQLSRGWLLFMCVPAAAIMGLVGTVYAEPAFLWLFLIFVFLGTFMVVNDQYARTRGEPTAARAAKDGVSIIGQLYVVAVCSASAVIVGRMIAQPMQSVGSALVPMAAVAGAEAARDQRRQSARVSVSESSELLIGNGPTTESDTVLMRIRAEHGGYWRGATFDWYMGSGWRSTLRPNISAGPRPSRGFPSAMFDPRMRDSVDVVVPRTELNDTPGRTHTLRQYVRLEGTGRFTDLYGAAEARQYRLMDSAVFGVPLSAYADEAGRIALNRPIASTYYEVESDIVEWSPDELRQASEEMPEAIRDLYVPIVISGGLDRLRALAQEVTRNASNRYDRVEALRQYLSSTCLYNLQAEAISADAGDVVSRFVFETKEGECKLFASALAVLCRTIGIPARVASGFLSGEFDPDYQYYVVRERDKHLWTEVYFAGHGWVPFDATIDARDVTPREEDGGLLDQGGWLRSLLSRGWLPPLAIALGLLLFAYVVIVELVMKRLRWRGRSGPSTLDASTLRVLQSYAWLSRKLRKRGLARKPHETPAEYERRLINATGIAGEAATELRTLTEMVMDIRYGMRTATIADAAEARRLATAILSALRVADRAAHVRPAAAMGAGA